VKNKNKNKKLNLKILERIIYENKNKKDLLKWKWLQAEYETND